MMIGQLGWEKIDLISLLKHMATMHVQVTRMNLESPKEAIEKD